MCSVRTVLSQKGIWKMHKANAKDMRVLHDFCFQLQVVKQHNNISSDILEFLFATKNSKSSPF